MNATNPGPLPAVPMFDYIWVVYVLAAAFAFLDSRMLLLILIFTKKYINAIEILGNCRNIYTFKKVTNPKLKKLYLFVHLLIYEDQ